MDYPLSRPFRERTDVSDKRDPDRFHNRYLACYHKLTRVNVDLLETESVFGQLQVWPDQCKDAIELFVDLQNASKNLSELLANTAVLPEGVKHQRYPIILNAGQINAQCRKVVSLLGNLPSLKVNSNRGRGSYEETRYLLKSIRSNLNELIDALQIERMNPLLSSADTQSKKGYRKL